MENAKHGLIYVRRITIPTWGSLYKIGQTTSPLNRFRSAQTDCPFEIEMVSIWEVDDMDMVECKLHKMFERNHFRGEWFKLTPKQVEQIKGMETNARKKVSPMLEQYIEGKLRGFNMEQSKMRAPFL